MNRKALEASLTLWRRRYRWNQTMRERARRRGDAFPVRPLVVAHAVWSIAGGFFMALYTPFCLTTLNLSTTTFGMIVAMGGIVMFLISPYAKRLMGGVK